MKAARDIGSGREAGGRAGDLDSGRGLVAPFSLWRAFACAVRRSEPSFGSSLDASSSASVDGGKLSFTLAVTKIREVSVYGAQRRLTEINTTGSTRAAVQASAAAHASHPGRCNFFFKLLLFDLLIRIDLLL